MSTKALGEWILASAASQGQWPITAHQEFLDGMSDKISDAVDEQLWLVLRPDTLSDPVFLSPAKTVACATEIGPFEHAIDIDSKEPDIQPDPSLLARGKQLCSQCPVRLDCLASGVRSLELQDGLYGGLSKQERQPIWQQNFDERLAQLQRAYVPLGEALSKLTRESDKKDELRGVLITLGRQLAKLCTEDSSATRQLDPDLKEPLTNPAITERIQWLLTPVARTIVRHWATACQESVIDPFKYDFEASPPTVPTVRRAEQLTTTTLRELAAGEFNYRRWNNRLGLNLHNPISFLIIIGEPVPDGDIETLKQIGREKADLLPRTQRQRSAKIQDLRLLLTEYYGLGENEPVESAILGKKYGVGEIVISRLVNSSIKSIKKLCGNLENDEEEL